MADVVRSPPLTPNLPPSGATHPPPQALWLRPPGNVSDAEYAKFYQALSKKPWEEPLAHTHFKVGRPCGPPPLTVSLPLPENRRIDLPRLPFTSFFFCLLAGRGRRRV